MDDQSEESKKAKQLSNEWERFTETEAAKEVKKRLCDTQLSLHGIITPGTVESVTEIILDSSKK